MVALEDDRRSLEGKRCADQPAHSSNAAYDRRIGGQSNHDKEA
jgi:hypothetical protein